MHIDRVYTLQEFAIFIFGQFGLKLPFWGVWGILPPNEFWYCRNPQKDRPWVKTHHMNQKQWKSLHGFDLGVCPRKNTVTSNYEKVIKPYCYLSPFYRPFSRWAWVSRYQNVSILDFIGAKGDGGGGETGACMTCKAAVKMSPPTNQHPAFLQVRCPSCRPTNSVTALKGTCYLIIRHAEASLVEIKSRDRHCYTTMDCCRVQWCDLLHCGNVILPEAKITPETLIFPKSL